MLDVNWFGGVTAGSDNTHMGTLAWDATNFPNAPTKIADLRDNQGVGVMTIEESYVGKGLAEHTALANQGYLIRSGCSTCAPVYLTSNDWWGRGGMIDWTQPAAGAYWAANKRQALINSGVMGHWLDLGEPEMYDAGDWAAGTVAGKNSHADYHNLYNLLWADSVAKGYLDNGDTQRPFVLSRSGAAGIQRDGTAMVRRHWVEALRGRRPGPTFRCTCPCRALTTSAPTSAGSAGDAQLRPQRVVHAVVRQLRVVRRAGPTAHREPVQLRADRSRQDRGRAEQPCQHPAALRADAVLLTGAQGLPERRSLVPPLVYYYQNDPNVREMGSEAHRSRSALSASSLVLVSASAICTYRPERGSTIGRTRGTSAPVSGSTTCPSGSTASSSSGMRPQRRDHPKMFVDDRR